MTSTLNVNAAVRAFSQRPDKRPLSEIAKFSKPEVVSDWQIIFDTETTIDAVQKLRVGVCQFRKSGKLVREYIFVADDLNAADLKLSGRTVLRMDWS